MAACNCQNSVLYTADEQKRPSCGEDKCRKPLDWIVGYLKTMKAIEESIAEYEINTEDSYQDGLEHSIQRIGSEAVFNSNREK